MRLSKIAAAAVMLTAAAVLPVVTASPAAAATPQCVLSLYHQNNYVPGNTNLSPNCVMGVGAVGNHVSTLQSSLNNCYRKGLAVDREFGPKTRDALKQVQSSLGIPADGVYGPQTARAMQHTIVAGGGACDRITF
ncbi:peptidoglycan-binding domain-containing protein [Micromonospora sp. NPDC051296]|uniref:peptidoglycan-binding domain-containing protein n=1 Tax=Micromonospora sp. NPDC051296 TaxID=3155046 RepID=UPI003445F566